MYVSRIKVTGLGCFDGPRAADLTVDPGPGWTVLAGPNGSGKTTLLQALARTLGAPDSPPPAGGAPGTVDLPGLAHWSSTGGAERQARTRALHLGADRTPPAALTPAAAALLDEGPLPDGWRVTDPARALVAPPDGPARPLTALGSGTAVLAAIVCALAGDARTEPADGATTVPRPGIALIDDVDLHLHPVRQQQIGGWLTTRFPQMQFLVAAHSPYVCQAADPGTLVRLAAPGEPAAPRVLDEDLHQRVLYGSGDDTALSELFGLPSAYSATAEAERRLLIRLERKLYTGRATSAELDAYRRLGAKLNSSLGARADELAARLLGDQP
ncbi:putative AbiEii toxin of type IV toxin-antitoxin system [Streptomyces sp. TLI_235]|nr:AAA family ATPase [Streptomyces sp. TLI_235]PBC78038.1 putative AbiEii toxin of type IV toxin-antitoxin system [Streptomyces sp. TLI_235]